MVLSSALLPGFRSYQSCGPIEAFLGPSPRLGYTSFRSYQSCGPMEAQSCTPLATWSRPVSAATTAAAPLKQRPHPRDIAPYLVSAATKAAAPLKRAGMVCPQIRGRVSAATKAAAPL